MGSIVIKENLCLIKRLYFFILVARKMLPNELICHVVIVGFFETKPEVTA